MLEYKIGVAALLPGMRYLNGLTTIIVLTFNFVDSRDTTMMPSVPGLLPLLSMLFAPKVELRVDVRQTRYTGVLCGLGTAPGEPDLPIYPDHDVEIVFDTNFDDEDIDNVREPFKPIRLRCV